LTPFSRLPLFIFPAPLPPNTPQTHGQAYTEQEYRDWLTEAGFVDFERVPLPSNPKNSIITARKPTA